MSWDLISDPSSIIKANNDEWKKLHDLQRSCSIRNSLIKHPPHETLCQIDKDTHSIRQYDVNRDRIIRNIHISSPS